MNLPKRYNIDQTANQQSSASQSNSWKPSQSVRQPVSCEPCRKRKIRCSRTKAPCDTCRRRRCPESCTYIRTQDTQLPVQATTSTPENPGYDELLNRISNLETMLRRQTTVGLPTSSDGSQETRTFSPSDRTCSSDFQRYQTPVSSGSHSSPGIPGPATNQKGSLTVSESGFTRYEPRSSQWQSVLANTGISLGTEADDGTENQVGFGFPFEAGPSPSIQDLLTILPPIHQCSQLKNVYFDVFSPVCSDFDTMMRLSDLEQLFHILHDPSFHLEYQHFAEDPESVSLSWMAILFVILSLAVTALEDEDLLLRDLGRASSPCKNIELLGRRYRGAAMKCIAKEGVFWGRHSVRSLQALIMLGYAMNHSQGNTWVLLGK
jgi:hypothetical protein